MTLSRIPFRFFILALIAVFCLLIGVLELAVVSEPYWMSSSLKNAILWTSGAAILFVPVSIFLGNTQRRVLDLLFGVTFLWLIFIAGLSLYVGSAFTGLLEVFVSLCWLVGWLFLRFRMERSYRDPKMRWYESMPKTIPHFLVEVLLEGGGKAHFRASRFDREGAFLFLDKDQAQGLLQKLTKNPVFCFRFRDKMFECQGRRVRSLRGDRGFGLKFEKLTPDQKKDLGDLVERLEGDGYVQ